MFRHLLRQHSNYEAQGLFSLMLDKKRNERDPLDALEAPNVLRHGGMQFLSQNNHPFTMSCDYALHQYALSFQGHLVCR